MFIAAEAAVSAAAAALVLPDDDDDGCCSTTSSSVVVAVTRRAACKSMAGECGARCGVAVVPVCFDRRIDNGALGRSSSSIIIML